MTGKQIAKMSDFAFAAWILQEKLDRMSNLNTPLAQKMRSAANTLRELDKEVPNDE